ncbi:outer membrane lipoprotein-sorting protein [Paucibacter sp. APW11]|uniref:Outer membrane lipoprotein-sorting protein n=1 Tax=Roseateles aquae TaxID=3077235 RepID=A0ABU3P581_9BURK|nr:outer membrane lipoprotein-sorting protein [Paucibacter sp. APW11]MDT8997734.1 outer membrane lipoprotein-sorting protein [Paucibacter sp. APW11]
MLCTLALLASPTLCLAAPDHEQLGRWIHDAENVLRGKTSAAVVSMKIKKASYERDYELMVYTDDRASSSKVLMRMLGPALWRGNATLKVAERISFFDPRTSRITVMGSTMLGENWMGSHFTNDDLMRETDLARHYQYRLLNTSSSKDESGDPVTQQLIELTPLPQAPVAWAKVLYRLNIGADQRALPLSVEYFRRQDDAKPARTLEYAGLKLIEQRKLPTRLTMSPSDAPGEFTRIEYRKLKFDVSFAADDFSERAFR